MAAPVIKIKRSSVPGKIPTTASLPLGELALNTNDGKIYIQQDSVGIGSTVIVVNPWSVGLGSDTYNTFFTSGSVGIGTTIPTSSLHVVGNTLVTGIVTATTFVVGSGVTINSSGINASGIITATTFIGTLTGTVTGTTSTELVRGNMGDNDQFRILVGATATNAGFVEIATADDGTEPIHVRQYTGVFSSLARTATLLDGSGNTSFPNSVTATTFVGALTGTATSTTNIPNLTGDITSVNKATTLATVNSNVGTFGNGTSIPTITVNAKGLITGVTTTAVASGLTLTDDTSTNASRFLTFTSATSGSISAANVSSTKLIYNPSTGALSATNFTSTSDISLKDNIQTIVNPLDKITKLNGVTFNWKENQKPSIGVIAQELEKVLPELVTQGNIKTVNYNGIIGVLIEAVKEQQKQIEELKDLVKNLTTPQ